MLTIDIRLADGRVVAEDLFGVFAALSRGEAVSFPAARPHQRVPLHAFCTQVAAMAMSRAGIDEPPGEAVAWRELLYGLTPDWPDGEAWELVVGDWSKPALLQPPLPEPGLRGEYKGLELAPDGLDMLVTSKNHDLKAERMQRGTAQDWFLALLTLQTTEGFMGAGNFGISRMNGGFGSRVFLQIRPEGGTGAAFRRDLRELLAARQEILSGDDRFADDGPGLIWLLPWSGKPPGQPFDGLDPFYVEICRRVRICCDAEGQLSAQTAGSKGTRIVAGPLNGVTGDPWAPLVAGGGKSWTPVEDIVFDYRLITRMLDPDQIILPVLAHPVGNDPETGLELVLTAMVRGQGKTSGFHERRVPLTRIRRTRTGMPVGLDRVGVVARGRMEDAGAIGRVLARALKHLFRKGGVFAGAPSARHKARIDYSDKAADAKIERWLVRFNAEVDALFFGDGFWGEVTGEDGDQAADWRRAVRKVALGVLHDAGETAPHSQVKRIRARADAEDYFRSGMAAIIREREGSGDG